ncbi:MAG: hypothetical protein R3A45_13410 [Bdellovibrionota bacterium]
MKKKFEELLFSDQFIESYRNGEASNPCVRCNTDVKFDILLQRAQELGADYLATGHYARLFEDEERYIPFAKAVDLQKDQSYFLFGMNQEEQLSRLMFPLGAMTKPEVRKLVRKLASSSQKKDSGKFVCTDRL